MPTAYIQGLQAEVAAVATDAQARRAEQDRAAIQAARERLTPLQQRVARVLESIPDELKKEGISLPSLQAMLKGRWRGCCHPGELGNALRKIGYARSRRWRGDAGFQALWFPIKQETLK